MSEPTSSGGFFLPHAAAHCQLVEGSALLPREIFCSGSFSAGARHRIPFNERACAEQAVVRRRDPLELSGRREPPHLALRLTRRVVRNLGAIVRVLIGDVDHRRHYGAARGGAAAATRRLNLTIPGQTTFERRYRAEGGTIYERTFWLA